MSVLIKRPEPAYWALDLFAAIMIAVLFAAVARTDAAWHRPIDIIWLALLALGIRVWCVANRDALVMHEPQLNERWHERREQPAEKIRCIREEQEEC